jgi:hypothetical protein
MLTPDGIRSTDADPFRQTEQSVFRYMWTDQPLTDPPFQLMADKVLLKVVRNVPLFNIGTL